MNYRLTAAVAALALAAAACGSGTSTGAPASSGPVKLAVWIMDGSVTQDLLKTFETRYEAAHPKTDLDLQIQEWDGIGEQVTAALASTDAPDVIEVGNTQVAQYAASGGVTDLTAKVADLKGEDWLPGLAEPGNIDGKQYGIPWYAANRVVIYRKDLFAKAGDRRRPEDPGRVARCHGQARTRAVTRASTCPARTGTRSPGSSGTRAATSPYRKAASGRARWTPPRRWPAWTSTRSSRRSARAPRTPTRPSRPRPTCSPRARSRRSSPSPARPTRVRRRTRSSRASSGFFPIPGKTADKPGAVFTGGSDLIIPAASEHQDAAYEVIKELAGEQCQTELAKAMSYVPNRTSPGLGAVGGDEGTAAMAAGAADGQATPNSPNWAAVEATNPVIKEYMTAVLTGADPAAEAKKADATPSPRPNAGKRRVAEPADPLPVAPTGSSRRRLGGGGAVSCRTC